MDEMVKGYMAGFDSLEAEPPKNKKWSVAYKHGWLNGRDDRLKQPRESAYVLRKRAELILKNATIDVDECFRLLRDNHVPVRP